MGRGKRRNKKYGAILNALYGRDSRLFPLSIVPPHPALFVVFIGIPSGSLCGGERTRYESDLN